MSIDIQRRGDTAMSQQLLHDLRINAHTDQNRRCAVSQIMEANVWQACTLEHSLVPTIQVTLVIEVADRVAKHVAAILPGRPLICFLLLLTLLMPFEGINQEIR